MLISLSEKIVAEIARSGPIGFERFVEMALYDADLGFYATTGRAGGRRGDFVTSVEVGPLFAAVVADWLDHQWDQAGQPSDFRVSEVGAGIGTLFRGVVRAAPRCFVALTYTLVETSASMRVAHHSLPTDVWESSRTLPAERQHVIVGNELLDNLAFGIAERLPAGWARVKVTVLHGDELRLAAGPPARSLGYLDELAPGIEVGHRVPTATAARSWVAAAQDAADRVLLFDYGADTAELAARGPRGWLRTYANHERGHDPFADIGQRDITHDVPIDQLPTPTVHRSQAEWLIANGLRGRVDQARQVWAERAHIGDLAAIAARSAIGEAEALTDPTGLGSFHALEWG